MDIKDEVLIVVRYSRKYDGAFYRHIAEAVDLGLDNEKKAIKDAFPDWWARCLRNTEVLNKRGLMLDD